MPSYEDWIAQAVEWERKEADALERGDELLADMCHNKAFACRYTASYAPSEEVEVDDNER